MRWLLHGVSLVCAIVAVSRPMMIPARGKSQRLIEPGFKRRDWRSNALRASEIATHLILAYLLSGIVLAVVGGLTTSIVYGVHAVIELVGDAQSSYGWQRVLALPGPMYEAGMRVFERVVFATRLAATRSALVICMCSPVAVVAIWIVNLGS